MQPDSQNIDINNYTDATNQALVLEYPELPSNLASVVSNQRKSRKDKLQDFSSFDLYDLIEEEDEDDVLHSINLNERMDWNAEDHPMTESEMDLISDREWIFKKQSVNRRAMISLGKGLIFGMSVGAVIAWVGRFIPKSRKMPIFWYAYVIGGSGFCCGTWNMVHQTRRYVDYINYQKTGVVNQYSMGMEEAKKQLGDYMGQTYHPKLVEEWKDSVIAEEFIKKETAL